MRGTTCAPAVMNVSRLPTAPEFIDEREYFDYAGQIVSPPPAATAQLPAVDLHGARGTANAKPVVDIKAARTF